MLKAIADEFQRQRRAAEKCLAQVPDDALNNVPFKDGNSLAMQVRHVTGNIVSRFTNFLTEDGEKPWRNRDAEFEERRYERADLDAMWKQAWDVLDETLGSLTEDDLRRTVRVRGQSLLAAEALMRSLAHLAYHVGQMVLLARIDRGDEWDWITIPKGRSEQFNRALDFGREES